MFRLARYKKLKSSEPKLPNLPTYYAVGKPIDLYRWVDYSPVPYYPYSGGSADTLSAYSFGFHEVRSPGYSSYSAPERYRQRLTTSYSTVRNSFTENSWTVFATFAEAQSYCLFKARNSFNRGMDIFEAEVMPAVLAVQLNVEGLQRKPVTVQEHIPDCPAPPEAAVKNFNAMIAPAANILATSYGFFAGRVIPDNRQDEFSRSLHQGINRAAVHEDSKKQILKGMTSLFGSYNKWFWHRFTRHHHDKVQLIMNKLGDKNQSVGDLAEFIREKLTEADLDLKVTHTGHYKRMLSYALVELEKLRCIDEPQSREHHNHVM